MEFYERFRDKLFDVTSENFEAHALELFSYQYEHNDTYRQYCDYLRVNSNKVSSLTEIPFLPIDFYKKNKITTGVWKEQTFFLSSGTTNSQRSKQYVRSLDHYLDVAKVSFEQAYGRLSDYIIKALLPSYQAQGHSSLISMVDHFISFAHPSSGYINALEEIFATQNESKVILIGVSYALLDLTEGNNQDLKDIIIMETGGMKGRRKELTREELHALLKSSFKVEQVHSEYGMAELTSQAYSQREGHFKFPPWAKILVRDINDPFTYVNRNKTGGINVIDLANISTCAFIETKDLGQNVDNQAFKVLGRFDNADLRGCNLMLL